MSFSLEAAKKFLREESGDENTDQVRATIFLREAVQRIEQLEKQAKETCLYLTPEQARSMAQIMEKLSSGLPPKEIVVKLSPETETFLLELAKKGHIIAGKLAILENAETVTETQPDVAEGQQISFVGGCANCEHCYKYPIALATRYCGECHYAPGVSPRVTSKIFCGHWKPRRKE